MNKDRLLRIIQVNDLVACIDVRAVTRLTRTHLNTELRQIHMARNVNYGIPEGIQRKFVNYSQVMLHKLKPSYASRVTRFLGDSRS